MLKINPGILSNIIILILFILVITDWFNDYLTKDTKRNLIIFLILSFFLGYINISLNNWRINLGGYILPIIAYIYLLWNSDKRLNLITATILLGCTYFLFKEIIRIDPVILIWNELIELSFLLVFIIIIITRNLKDKLILSLGSIIFGELLFNLYHINDFTYVFLGDEKIGDIFWLLIIELLLIHILVLYTMKEIKKKKQFKL